MGLTMVGAKNAPLGLAFGTAISRPDRADRQGYPSPYPSL